MLAILKRNIRDLNNMVHAEANPVTKAGLMKTLSSLIKDEHDMACKIALRDRDRMGSSGEKEARSGSSGGLTLVFGGESDGCADSAVDEDAVKQEEQDG